MKLGAYTACLHDKPLAEALVVLEWMNLTGAEINSGGVLVTRACRSMRCRPARVREMVTSAPSPTPASR